MTGRGLASRPRFLFRINTNTTAKATTKIPTTVPVTIGTSRWGEGLVEWAVSVCTDEVLVGGIDRVVVAAALESAGTVPFPMMNFWKDS